MPITTFPKYKNNIAVMNRSHDQAAKEYQDGIKSLEKNADTIISAGNEAVKQLKRSGINGRM